MISGHDELGRGRDDRSSTIHDESVEDDNQQRPILLQVGPVARVFGIILVPVDNAHITYTILRKTPGYLALRHMSDGRDLG